jgi:hypothetical protein
MAVSDRFGRVGHRAVMFVLGYFFDRTKYQRCFYLPIFFVSPSFHLAFHSSQQQCNPVYTIQSFGSRIPCAEFAQNRARQGSKIMASDGINILQYLVQLKITDSTAVWDSSLLTLTDIMKIWDGHPLLTADVPTTMIGVVDDQFYSATPRVKHSN